MINHQKYFVFASFETRNPICLPSAGKIREFRKTECLPIKIIRTCLSCTCMALRYNPSTHYITETKDILRQEFNKKIFS